MDDSELDDDDDFDFAEEGERVRDVRFDDATDANQPPDDGLTPSERLARAKSFGVRPTGDPDDDEWFLEEDYVRVHFYGRGWMTLHKKARPAFGLTPMSPVEINAYARNHPAEAHEMRVRRIYYILLARETNLGRRADADDASIQEMVAAGWDVDALFVEAQKQMDARGIMRFMPGVD